MFETDRWINRAWRLELLSIDNLIIYTTLTLQEIKALFLDNV